MTLLPWMRKPTFLSWEEYERKIDFMDTLAFQQRVRRQNCGIV